MKIKITEQNAPYILIDLIHEHTELVRMPKKPAQTPEFRLVTNSGPNGELIKEIRNILKEYKN